MGNDAGSRPASARCDCTSATLRGKSASGPLPAPIHPSAWRTLRARAASAFAPKMIGGCPGLGEMLASATS